MRDFGDALGDRVLLGDGALGTYFFDQGIALGENTDLLNLSDPELVLAAHEEYVRAGSEVIETNTFGANPFKLGIKEHEASVVKEVNAAGARLARKAAGDSVYVGGSVGPSGLFPLKEEDCWDAGAVQEGFSIQIEALLDGGVDFLVLETFSCLEELMLAIRAARALSSGVFLFAQMVFPSKGLSAEGFDAALCAEEARRAGANGFGSNCGRGVRSMIEAFSKLSRLKGSMPLSAFPNAGLPESVGGRMVYPAQPAYMARGLAEMIKLGARLVGGCCGTTPHHISEFKKLLRLRPPRRSRIEVTPGGGEPAPRGEAAGRGALLDGLVKERIPVFVELDPPMHLDVDGVVEGAVALRRAGADAITIAENPLAILRCDNLALAAKIRERCDAPVVLHMTGRDRNVLALQGRVMAAHLFGIEGILAITGDPAAASDQPGVSGVFDLDSIGLVKTVSGFNRGVNLAGRPVQGRTKFSIGVAFSYRPANPGLQVKRLERKVDAGAHFVMTQPLFSAGHIEAVMELTSHLDVTLFPGIFPLISARNAEFLHNEVPGISVPKELRDRLWMYDAVEDQRKAAREFTWELVERVCPHVDGLYLISPLNKWDVALDLVSRVRASGLDRR